MNTIVTFVGAWTPFIVAVFVLAEIGVGALVVAWSRRGSRAARRGDPDLAARYFSEGSALSTIAGFIAVLPAVHGLLMLVSFVLTGNATSAGENAIALDVITTGLVGLTFIAVAMQIVEMKYRRYVAGARQALEDHQMGGAACCTSLH